MKILIVHNRYIYPGGEDEVAASEERLLREQKHDVRVYTRHNQELQDASLKDKVKHFLQFGRADKKVYADLSQLLQNFRPDVVHVHNPFFVIGGAVYQACFEQKIPIVQSFHNYRLMCPIGIFFRNGRACEDCLQKGFFQSVIHRCWKKSFMHSYYLSRYVKQLRYEQDIISKISKVIVTSRFTLQKYEAAGFPRNKFVLKPNFLEFDPDVRNAEGSYALYIGALQDYKGIDLLLKIWTEQSITYPIKVVGTGPLEKDLKQKYQKSNIEFLGQKSQSDILRLMKEARCLIVPSVCYENFPRVVVEAFACGVPVIASSIGALGGIVDHNINGFHFNPYNPSELKIALDRLFTDTDAAKNMGQMARKKFLEQYSKESNYRQLMAIYESALTHANG